VNDSTKTGGFAMARNVHPIGGMNRDKLIRRHTDTCMAQIALEQAMSRLHALGYAAEYQALAAAWGVVCTERARISDRLFPKTDRRTK
jgi:hypothetical protein